MMMHMMMMMRALRLEYYDIILHVTARERERAVEY